jgi:hypothetical protein
MPQSELRKLYGAVMDAFRLAKETFERDPQPGTPEWDNWQRLLTQLFEANQAHAQAVKKQFTRTIPFRQPDSD